MSTNLKALVVILALAWPVFMVAKPICLRFMAETVFCRRRNVWLLLTITAFISPSFWLYAAVALPLMFWAGNKDDNPVALYVLLLHVIPPIGLELPAIVINKFFELDSYRILAFAILVPTAWRLLNTKDKAAFGKHAVIDRFMWAYLALQLVLLMPYEDITNTMRRGVLMVLDDLALVYVVSRSCMDRRKIIEVLALYCLASAIFVPIAIFESQKLWLVYTGLASVWDIPNRGAYLFRDGSLRAQVSTGHSLALGYLLALAFGFWLYLSTHVQSQVQRFLGSIGIWVGLVAALSRAPWITAILAYFTFIVFSPKGFGKLIKTLLIALPLGGLVLISPLGPKIIDKLPFVGKVDSFNVEYRQRLADTSWELIKQHPLLGDPFFMSHMENMRQGEGIIDLVNVYAATALLYGGVGLLLFLTPFLHGIIVAWRQMRGASRRGDLDTSLLGASLLACMLGTAFFMATGSLYGALPKAYYLLVGLTAAYGQLKQTVAQQYSGGNKQE